MGEKDWENCQSKSGFSIRKWENKIILIPETQFCGSIKDNLIPLHGYIVWFSFFKQVPVLERQHREQKSQNS